MAKKRYTDLDLEKIASKVKRANERLRRLEREGLENISNAYNFINKESHDKASYLSTTGTGKVKFRTDIRKLAKSDIQTLNKLQAEVDKFLSYKTSTVGGVKDKYKSAKDFIDKESGDEGDWEDVANLFTSTMYTELIKEYGYSDTMDLLAEITEAYNIDLQTAIAEVYKMKGSSLSSIRRSLKERYGNQFKDKSEDEIASAIRGESEKVQ